MFRHDVSFVSTIMQVLAHKAICELAVLCSLDHIPRQE